MNELFGIPVGTLAVVLAVALAAGLGARRRARAAQPLLAQARPAQRRRAGAAAPR